MQASGSVRFGFAGYTEGSWYLLKIARSHASVGAYVILRNRSSGSISSLQRYRVPLAVITLGCGAMLVAATYTEWSDADTLISDTFVPDRTPFLVWLLLIALLPIASHIVLAARAPTPAQVSLATIATLAVLNYFAEARAGIRKYTQNGTTWAWVAVAHLLMAAVAWSAVIVRRGKHHRGDRQYRREGTGRVLNT